MTTVLIVEDEAPIADTIEYALQNQGLGTVRATTVESAVSFLDGCGFVVLDVGLPDKSGLDLLKEIRSGSAGTNRRIPIILLTARTEEIDRILGLELGADDYVGKPFSPRELAARVKAILRRTAEPDSPRAFLLDDGKSIIQYYGQSLSLSRTEYKILSLLIRHPGWVFSRDKIMDLAYEGSAMEDSLDRSVDTHVKNLRAKLRRIRPEDDPIETRHGLGYCLKA